MHLFPSWPLLSAFLVASLILAITPGPGVFYIVTRSAAQGRRHGLASVAGVAMGNLGNAIGASVGLAALFTVSSLAFTVVKYAGALYLVYLGVQALRASDPNGATRYAAPAQLRRVFRDGFVVALLNPKTTIFFAAFLPQFMSTETASLVQSIALGSMFVAIAAVTDSAYALSAARLGPVLGRAWRVRAMARYLSGGAFIGLALCTVLAASERAR
ncbi:MAG TPA: LysE family translocator [Casimicrobiaceae bacterium]|jgi:threonine/homoserine/homoserine lactone efflux protein|nr:LysE family translocator [Casimicrobiaceae bacterium]